MFDVRQQPSVPQSVVSGQWSRCPVVPWSLPARPPLTLGLAVAFFAYGKLA
jgi:hypothetical protein